MAPVTLALVDAGGGEEWLELVRGALAAALEALPPSALFGLVAFGAHVRARARTGQCVPPTHDHRTACLAPVWHAGFVTLLSTRGCWGMFIWAPARSPSAQLLLRHRGSRGLSGTRHGETLTAEST